MLIFDANIKRIHCIGIGGAGVSAIAECLLDAGYKVTGSNLSASPILDRLKKRGATVYIGHDAKHVNDADLCIYSSAINRANPEWIACEQNNIPLMKRGEALAYILATKQSVGVAGTHGKTTTTSLVTWLLLAANKDPSYAIGGEIHDTNKHACYHEGDYFVAELDESDASFLFAKPNNIIITNIDHDHLTTYNHSYDVLLKSFAQFVEQMQPNGLAVIGGDDVQVCALAKATQHQATTYGFTDHVDYKISQFAQFPDHIEFELVGNNDKQHYSAPLIGRHNAANVTAAIIMARHLGLSVEQIQQGLHTFPGVDRRLNYQGTMDVALGTVSIYDDYGHHPQAVIATLEAMQEAFGMERIICVFQPHRYTRTQDCFKEFVEALRIPDQVFILPIYAASEEPIAGVTSKALNDALAKTGQKTQFIAKQDLLSELHQNLQSGDVVIFQGAGDIVKLARDMVATA